MSELINDGGGAFPTFDGVLFTEGLSIRDYFAAAALQSTLSSALSVGTKTNYNINKNDFFECVSIDAYAHADAMIKARGAKP